MQDFCKAKLVEMKFPRIVAWLFTRGMLKIVADAVPAVRPLLGFEPDAYFYAMMFGLPDVKYARSSTPWPVDRSSPRKRNTPLPVETGSEVLKFSGGGSQS